MTVAFCIFLAIWLICEANKIGFSFYTFHWIKQHEGLGFLMLDDSVGYSVLESEESKALAYRQYGMPFANIKVFKQFKESIENSFPDFMPDYIKNLPPEKQTPFEILETLMDHNEKEVAYYALFNMYACDIEYTKEMVPYILECFRDRDMLREFYDIVCEGYSPEIATSFIGHMCGFLSESGVADAELMRILKTTNSTNDENLRKKGKHMSQAHKDRIITSQVEGFIEEFKKRNITEYDRMAAQLFMNGVDSGAFRLLAMSIKDGTEKIEWRSMIKFILEVENPFEVATDADLETIRTAVNEFLEKEEEFDLLLKVNQLLTKKKKK